MEILRVAFFGLILLVISCVVLDIRKKFRQDSKEPMDPNPTKANAPLEISRERIELIRYRVDETKTFLSLIHI